MEGKKMMLSLLQKSGKRHVEEEAEGVRWKIELSLTDEGTRVNVQNGARAI
jgi:hypothetical protein